MKMPENCEEGSNTAYNVVSRRTCSILMGKISALILRLFWKSLFVLQFSTTFSNSILVCFSLMQISIPQESYSLSVQIQGRERGEGKVEKCKSGSNIKSSRREKSTCTYCSPTSH